MVHEISLHIDTKKLNKLAKGKTIQLNHPELANALSKQGNVVLQMLKKDVNGMLRAHKNKKGFRFSEKKIVGGKIHWKDVGRKMKRGFESLAKNKAVRSLAKSGAKMALDAGSQYATAQTGMDFGNYANIAKSAVDTEDLGKAKKQLVKQAGKDALKGGKSAADNAFQRAHEKLDAYGQDGGKLNFGKILKKVGRAVKSVATNPMAQQIALDMAMAGAGVKHSKKSTAKAGPKPKRLVKGSAEAKAHMAKVRAGRKGGSLFPAGVRGGSGLYPAGTN